MCMSILKQTETDWVLPLSRCVTKGGELASPIEQWWWSGWRGSSTCSRIKAAGPSSGWRGLRQAGGRGSSENSVYVAFLKSRRSFTGLGEHHWWKYMHWDQMLERLPKSAQNRHHVPIIKARMLMMIKRHMWSELVRETSQQRCLLAIWQEDCNLPQVGSHIHSFWKVYFLNMLASHPDFRACCFELCLAGTRANFSFSWINFHFPQL